MRYKKIDPKISKLVNEQTEVIKLRDDEYNDSRAILQNLAKKGITSIFCEAGKLITKFVKANSLLQKISEFCSFKS